MNTELLGAMQVLCGHAHAWAHACKCIDARHGTDLELVHELLRGGREDDDAAGAGVDEALLHGLVDEGQQRVVVAVHVQQPNLRAAYICMHERRGFRQR